MQSSSSSIPRSPCPVIPRLRGSKLCLKPPSTATFSPSAIASAGSSFRTPSRELVSLLPSLPATILPSQAYAQHGHGHSSYRQLARLRLGDPPFTLSRSLRPRTSTLRPTRPSRRAVTLATYSRRLWRQLTTCPVHTLCSQWLTWTVPQVKELLAVYGQSTTGSARVVNHRFCMFLGCMVPPGTRSVE